MKGEGLGGLKGAFLALVGIGIVMLMGIAVVTGFKETGKVSNDTADDIITAITVGSGFLAVVILALFGKAIMKMF